MYPRQISYGSEHLKTSLLVCDEWILLSDQLIFNYLACQDAQVKILDIFQSFFIITS